jgi:large subunit ribosomal protein L35
MSAKQKSHKGARKRFKLTANGKVKHKRSFAGHLMSGKPGHRKRRLRQAAYLHKTVAAKIRSILGK